MASRNLVSFQGAPLETLLSVYGSTGAALRKIQNVLLDSPVPAGTFPADPLRYWDFADGLTDVCAGHVPLVLVGMSGVATVPGGFFVNAIRNATYIEVGTGLVRASTPLSPSDNYVVSFWRMDEHETEGNPTSRVKTGTAQLWTPPATFDAAEWGTTYFHHFICMVDNYNFYMYVDGVLDTTRALELGEEASVGGNFDVYMGQEGGLISELCVWEDYDLSSQDKRDTLVSQMWHGGTGIIWLDGAWEEIMPV
jgi:hypothetical protein